MTVTEPVTSSKENHFRLFQSEETHFRFQNNILKETDIYKINSTS